MPTTLNTVQLPDDLLWVDEFNWSPVKTKQDVTLAGTLLLQNSQQFGGRPITLASGEDYGWVPRSTLLALQALRDASSTAPLTLTLADNRQFQVLFDRTQPEGGLSAEPVVYFRQYSADGDFKVELKLIRV